MHSVWMKTVEQHTAITGDILKTKAAQLFPRLYPGDIPPKFSEGWFTGWKEQYGVKQSKPMARPEAHPLMNHNTKCKKFERFFPSMTYEMSIIAMKLPITGGCNLTGAS